MLKKIFKELDEQNMGNGSLNAQRIHDGIKHSNYELKALLISKFGSQSHSSSVNPSNLLQNTFLNCNTIRHAPSTIIAPETTLLRAEDGIWCHFLGNKVRVLPRSFLFPPKKSLLSFC